MTSNVSVHDPVLVGHPATQPLTTDHVSRGNLQSQLIVLTKLEHAHDWKILRSECTQFPPTCIFFCVCVCSPLGCIRISNQSGANNPY